MTLVAVATDSKNATYVAISVITLLESYVAALKYSKLLDGLKRWGGSVGWGAAVASLRLFFVSSISAS